ncbi:MAG: AAA family ATPase [Candidatus Wallbacteria bacterium]|nr:AAA family ATPase [Candidatus Wallbacteria bacterium]
MKSFSVFVSSPGDLFDERAASYDILRRLQSEYAGRLAIEPIVWEHLPLGANAGFQEQLVSPGECDVVVCMLWGRLGTRLPAGFKKPDGSPYDSGTEYEFMQALEGAGREKAPVLLVYRKTAKLKLDLDDPQLADKVEQRTKLETFFKKWFFNPDGMLARAFHQFEDPATFATRLEEHLRDILKHHLPAGSEDAVIEPTWEGSPYRGLDVFDYEHTRIFFGRSRAVNEVVDAMRRQAQERRAFVAVIGTSGSGKSSLLRAGVLPTLCEKHVVEGVEAWRRALVRPSASGGNLLLGLAEALLQPGALPELAAAQLDAHGLARLLAAPSTAIHGAAFLELLRDALGVVAGEVAVAPALPKARLVLVLDQFEELFAMAELTDINRTDFISCISRLARSGMVWVLASLRSDFYPHCQSLPELVALKEGKGQYDLLPPGAGEIAQIIGLPTRMAGLRFEDAPLTGTGLADRLLEAAMKSPESLPLLEFALEELYKTRTDKGVLTLAAYKTMGGLEGALARRAEEVFASLALELQAAMPSVMRRLVRMEAGAKMSASGVRVPYDTVAAGPETRKFVDAFVTARLFVTTRSQDGTPLVGIAHEALLGNWPRLRNWLEANGEFLLWKMRLENALEEWGRLGQHPSLLLSGPALDEACRWLERFRDDLPEPSRKYIDQSRAAAEAAAREQQAAHDHELALIRAEAAAAGRLRRQARVLTGVCGLAITMAVLAVSYWGKARRVSQSLLAEKGEVIRQGQIALERDLTFRAADALRVGQAHAAIALATEAMRRSPDGARILRAEQVLRSCEERYGARALLGHEDFVESIAFSSDGKRVVTGSLDRTARI